VDTWEEAQRGLSRRRHAGGRWLTTLSDAVAARSPQRRQHLQQLRDAVLGGAFGFGKHAAWEGGSAAVASKLTLEVTLIFHHAPLSL
jgi:hypothetical protein